MSESLSAAFQLYQESDVWDAIQRVVRGRQTTMYVYQINHCVHLQLQMVLEIYLPFDDESSPLDLSLIHI